MYIYINIDELNRRETRAGTATKYSVMKMWNAR